MTETAPYIEPTAATTRPIMHVSLPPSSALEQAQQHLRDLRSEPITDLDTALLRLDEERRKYVQIVRNVVFTGVHSASTIAIHHVSY